MIDHHAINRNSGIAFSRLRHLKKVATAISKTPAYILTTYAMIFDILCRNNNCHPQQMAALNVDCTRYVVIGATMYAHGSIKARSIPAT